ncbi:MAG: hypothetical protein DDT35_01561 [Firmicutes bacterium]|nr:hypothetical protein [Bacillota bacterium]
MIARIDELFCATPLELDNACREILESKGAILPATWEPSRRINDAFDLVRFAEHFQLFQNKTSEQWPTKAYVCCMADTEKMAQEMQEEAQKTGRIKDPNAPLKYYIAAPGPALAMVWAFLFARIVEAQRAEAAEQKSRLAVVKPGLVVAGGN